MTLNPIYLLRFTRPVKTNIDGHFIYKIQKKFLVYTSQKIKGIECIKVSDTNIKGENKPQYVADIVHKYDPNLHKLTQTKECNTYFAANKESCSVLEQKLKLAPEFPE